MPEPRLTILGVYRPAISEQTWQEQWDVTADDEATRNHFDKLVLIEAIVDRKSEPRFASSHRTAYVHVGLSSDKAALAVHQRW